jgi:hypothetical protein
VFEDPQVELEYPFYRDDPMRIVSERDLRSLPAPAEPIFLVRHEPFEAPAGEATPGPLVYSEFPGAESAFMRAHVHPLLDGLRDTLLHRGFQRKRLTWLSVYRMEPPTRSALTR